VLKFFISFPLSQAFSKNPDFIIFTPMMARVDYTEQKLIMVPNIGIWHFAHYKKKRKLHVTFSLHTSYILFFTCWVKLACTLQSTNGYVSSLCVGTWTGRFFFQFVSKNDSDLNENCGKSEPSIWKPFSVSNNQLLGIIFCK